MIKILRLSSLLAVRFIKVTRPQVDRLTLPKCEQIIIVSLAIFIAKLSAHLTEGSEDR